MKAVVIRNPGKSGDVWKLVDRPEPTAGPGQVLVRVRATSLNYRDLAIAEGRYGGPLKEDLIALADAAGEVVALGAGASRFQIGDRVCAAYFPSWHAGAMRPEDFASQRGAHSNDGALAEYIVVEEGGLVRFPEHLSFEEAATLPCAAVTAWNALIETPRRPAPGSTVLVQGTGGVSLFAAQLALKSGLRVIGTSSSAAKIARLHELGVADVIDYRAKPEWHKEALRLTGGAGVDHIVDVGGAGTLAESLQAVRRGGTISLIGILTGVGATIDPLPILFRASNVEGILVGSVRSFETMNAALSAWTLKPVVDQVFSLAEAPAALAKMSAATHFGKIVVRL
jgi:NADPH:quinone reductase-like Zn-dependent oxidoreductase